MPGRESILAALKRMNKNVDWGSHDAAREFSHIIWSENDRGVIILNGSGIEELLDLVIKKQMTHLNSDETTYLFGFNGPIGTFSAKIRMAYALGLISRQIYRKIDIIREMRNTCAHSSSPITFQTTAIHDATVYLAKELRMELPDENDNSSIRNTFMLACVMLMMAVRSGSLDEARNTMVSVLKESRRQT